MNSKKIDTVLTKAVACSLKGQNAKADKLFGKALECCTDDAARAGCEYLIGCHENRKGEYGAAIDTLSSALKHYPQGAAQLSCAYYELGYAYYASKKYDEAVAAFEKADVGSNDIHRSVHIKVLLNESRMLSEKVYEPKEFLDDCNKLRSVGGASFADICRMCAVGSVAAYMAGDNNQSLSHALCGVRAGKAVRTNREEIFSGAVTCAKMLCLCAVTSDRNDIMSAAVDEAYELVSTFSDVDISSDDDIQTIMLLRVRQLLGKGDKETAAQILDEIKNEPTSSVSALAFHYYGLMAQGKNDYAKALIKLGKGKNRKSVSLLNSFDGASLAKSAQETGFTEMARDMYRHILGELSDSREQTQILYPLARLEHILGNHTECTEYCKKLIALLEANGGDNDISADAYRLLSVSLAAAGDTGGATASYDVYISHISSDREKYFAAVKNAYEYDYPREYCVKLGESFCETIEKQNIADAMCVEAFNFLGLLYYRTGADVSKEISAFTKANEMAEKSDELRSGNIRAAIYCNLAECYLRIDDKEKAMETCKKAEGIFSGMEQPDPIQFASCLKQLASIMISMEDIEGALEKLEHAIEILDDEDSSEKSVAMLKSACLNALGTVHFRLGRPDQEIRDISEALKLVEDKPVSRDDLVTLYGNRGDAYEKVGDLPSMASDYMCVIDILEQNENESNFVENRLARADKLLAIGAYHESSGHFHRCRSSINDAVALIDSVQDAAANPDEYNALAAFAQFQLACICANPEIKDYSSSLAAYGKCIELLDKLPDSPQKREHLSTAYSSRAEFYEVFGEHALAVEDLKKSKEYKDE